MSFPNDNDKGFYKVRQCGYNSYEYCNGICESCGKNYRSINITDRTKSGDAKYPYTYLNHSILNDRRV